jgi:hypothetical protein
MEYISDYKGRKASTVLVSCKKVTTNVRLKLHFHIDFAVIKSVTNRIIKKDI